PSGQIYQISQQNGRRGQTVLLVIVQNLCLWESFAQKRIIKTFQMKLHAFCGNLKWSEVSRRRSKGRSVNVLQRQCIGGNDIDRIDWIDRWALFPFRAFMKNFFTRLSCYEY